MELTEVAKLRRYVLTSLARYTWNDELPERVYDILYKGIVSEDSPRYRCCVHKERAVLKNRIDMALGLSSGINIIDAAKIALVMPADTTLPIIDVLPVACDQCPIDKYMVTDACRHCISHKCLTSCPRQAISFYQNRAFIDKNKCVECGRCKDACPYGVILEVNRPCERACALGAISAGSNRKASIDFNKCIQCGACRNACPFGAIDERSCIIQLLQSIKRGKKIIAILAPSAISQFGHKTTISQLIAAIKQLGVHEVVEAAVGADITAAAEAQEFLHKVPEQQPYMTSSCCPSFTSLIKKHLPQLNERISETPSPMLSAAAMIKKQHPDAMTLFIGPCIAKKAEGRANAALIDYVITFEELACVLQGADIRVNEQDNADYISEASAVSLEFPLHGGVSAAVSKTVKQLSGQTVSSHYSAGLDNCLTDLVKTENGEIDCSYFEGMACPNGCIDGPGVIMDFHLVNVDIKKYAAAAPLKSPLDSSHR